MRVRHPDPKAQSLPTVLVAEADDGLRGVLAGCLANEGWHVVAVEDGLELFDYLQLASSSGGRIPLPQLVVSDVELAGCSGLAACRRLRAGRQRVPVVLIAGDRWAEREALRAGAADVLHKPIDVAEVRSIVSLL